MLYNEAMVVCFQIHTEHTNTPLWADVFNVKPGGIYDMIYFLTAVGLSPGGSTHLHTNNT